MAKSIGAARRRRSKREAQRRQRLITFGGGFVLVVALALVAAGFYKTRIREPASPVAVVNGTKIRTDEYQKQVHYQNFLLLSYASQLQQSSGSDQQASLTEFFQNQFNQLPEQVLQQMIDNELVRQEAEARGITVTDAEVQASIEEQFGLESAVDEDSEQPTLTQAEFDRRYQDYLANLQAQTDLTEADYREVIRMRLLREKLQQQLADKIPTQAEQVHARHILVDSRQEAEEVLQRIEEGEDFAALAQEYSTDTSTKEDGGDLGWFARGEMVFEFEEVAFELEPGEVSDVVDSQFGFHIIQVLGHEQNRELDDETLQQRRDQALSNWLQDARTNADIEQHWSPEKVPDDLQNPFATAGQAQPQVPSGQQQQP